MNCIYHPETPAVAYCRTCGKALCEACQRTAQGTVYCAEHLPATASTPSSAQPLTPQPPAAAPFVPPLPHPAGATPASKYMGTTPHSPGTPPSPAWASP